MDQAVEQPRLRAPEPPSVADAWEMVIGQLRAEMRRGDYESYVAPLQPLSFKEGVYRVGGINTYACDWVKSRLTHRISKLLTVTYGHEVTLHFTLINGAERLVETAETPAKINSAPVNGNGVVTTSNGVTTRSNGTATTLDGTATNGSASGRKKKAVLEAEPVDPGNSGGSPRKIQLQQAYGAERAAIIQPERAMFVTLYLFNNWLPLIGHSALTVILAARSLCYWNVRTGELRNTIETDMSELARRASVSVRTVKDVLNQELVKKYFLRYKVRRIMTSNGVRTAGIVLQVRMDDPLTPEDQDRHDLPEGERWFTADFEDEEED